MIPALKFAHFLSLWLAGGIGLGGWVLQNAHARAGVRPSPEVLRAVTLLARIGLGAIVLLWISGLALAWEVWGGLPDMPAFSVKFVAAGLLLAASLSANLEALRAVKEKRPPRANVMISLTFLMRFAIGTALIAAVIAFN